LTKPTAASPGFRSHSRTPSAKCFPSARNGQRQRWITTCFCPAAIFGTLSDGYLHAAYTIPRTDAGAFEITIRLYEKDKEPLIAIQHLGGSEAIYQSSSNSGGKLMAITVNRPEFWRYRDGAWLRVEDAILPGITVGDVLTRYRDHYKAHLYQPTQQKYIHLAYDLPREGTVVQVTGRENFMDPGKKEVWAEFNYDGDRFLPSAKAK
jgi:hypothetical protein